MVSIVTIFINNSSNINTYLLISRNGCKECTKNPMCLRYQPTPIDGNELVCNPLALWVRINDYFDNWFKGFKDKHTHDVIYEATTS